MMSENFLASPIEYLKGVGPQRAEVLKSEAGIRTFGDLLLYYPFRYMDRTKFSTVQQVRDDGSYVQLKGTITRLSTLGDKRRKRLVAYFTDGSGTLELVWFQGIRWISEKLRSNTEYIVYGKPNFFGGKLSIAHPDLQEAEEERSTAGALQPVYNSTEKLSSKGLDSKGIMRLTLGLVTQLKHVPETLPKEVVEQLRLIPATEALKGIHFPDSPEHLSKAIFRLKFEELFFGQLRIGRLKLLREKKHKGLVFENIGPLFKQFYDHQLPFPLTEAQKRVMKEIRSDLRSGKQMNRLLQGDVGSGKTVVALMSMLIALDNRTQACLMAPTEILATQHFNTINSLLQGTGIRTALLTGSTKTSVRKKITAEIASGEPCILIGTHALLEDDVMFKQLGLAVIDEQHKFGVEQRARLWNRQEDSPPHVLVMTATPIPRTLAMTFYGDLDVSVIDELPPGRKPISTVHRFESQRLRIWGFLKEQIAQGRQAYIVYPLIEESEKLDLNNLYQGYEAICKDFPAPQYRVSIVHGKMTPADKEFEMQRFMKNETQIMVATTVIEVGVNVPNASVMVIENAERFGLSQMHQLRGRVGRGADKSYCILVSSFKISQEARLRIDTMCRTNDGFEIAETDLTLRGPGDIMGTQQSGEMDFRIADLTKDGQILSLARKAALELLQKDHSLSLPGNQATREQYIRLFRDKPDWGKIA